MLFNSFHFLVFFLCVVPLYFLFPVRHRWALLLVASYYFYMSWRWEYAFLILGSTVIDYGAGLAMGRSAPPQKRRYLMLSLVSNLGLLVVFKYLGFFADSAQAVTALFGSELPIVTPDLLLPVGISFYTFQTLSYTIDVYRGEREPERHFGIFALYVAFFPQLVAGPIERSTRLLPQLRQERRFDAARATSGCRLILWGLFKKVVVADSLALFVEPVYASPDSWSAGVVVLATYAFGFQIFCDFSGYSDIAIGAARVLGIDLMVNFRRPYFATSVREFWRRWHISLSTWFRDYVYLPLGGSRGGTGAHARNLMLVFLVSGLWHGASWTFVIWGGLHGSYILGSLATQDGRARFVAWSGLSRVPRLHAALQTVLVFQLVSFAWIFFRAESLSSAMVVCQRLLAPSAWLVTGMGFPELPPLTYAYAVGGLVILEGVDLLQHVGRDMLTFDSFPRSLRWVGYSTLIWLIVVSWQVEPQPFIYFVF
jgi:alginate O-acetyltransferase complex protein AlgI